MHQYLIHLSIYTLAMTGIIFIAFLIAKRSLSLGNIPGRRNNSLEIENRLSLEPRKNLYIIKAGEERFLISTDAEGSRFLTKLEQNNIPVYRQEEETYSCNLPELSPDNISKNGIKNNNSVMRRMLNKLNSETITKFE